MGIPSSKDLLRHRLVELENKLWAFTDQNQVHLTHTEMSVLDTLSCQCRKQLWVESKYIGIERCLELLTEATTVLNLYADRVAVAYVSCEAASLVIEVSRIVALCEHYAQDRPDESEDVAACIRSLENMHKP